MSTFRIASSFLIFLVALFNSVEISWSGTDHLTRLTDIPSRPSVRTAQLLQEISEQEYRTGQFIRAARSGEIDKVRKFLAEGTDVNSKNRNEDTALMEACSTGQKEVVELLLAKGADLNAKDNYQQTALQWAAMKGQRTVEEVLKNAGAKNP